MIKKMTAKEEISMESRCGILCGKCDWQKAEKCKETKRDFGKWGLNNGI